MFSTPVRPGLGQLAAISVYGPTGATAYFGMTGIGKPRTGETVVGLRRRVPPVRRRADRQDRGRSGGRHCRRSREVPRGGGGVRLRRLYQLPRGQPGGSVKHHCPRGVNVYFENVGGPILDAVLGRLAPKARVVLCGVISSYLTGDHPGPANYVDFLAKTALMQGFNALDQWVGSRRPTRRCASGRNRSYSCTVRPSWRASSVCRRTQRAVHRGQYRQDAGQGE